MKNIFRISRILPAMMLLAVPVSQASELDVKSLRQLHNADQSERMQFQGRAAWSSENLKALAGQDALRVQQVRKRIKAGTLKSSTDLYGAAIILQHGQNADDFLLAHILASAAAFKGHKKARWLAAASLDRYLQNIGKAQVFGTQYRTETLDREKSIWTMNLLDEDLVADETRDAYDVPPLSKGMERLFELNKVVQNNESVSASKVVPGTKYQQ